MFNLGRYHRVMEVEVLEVEFLESLEADYYFKQGPINVAVGEVEYLEAGVSFNFG